MLGCQSVPYRLGYFDLGVVECHTLFIDYCLIYENLLSLGYFTNL